MDPEDFEALSLDEKLAYIKTQVGPLDVAEMAGCDFEGDKIRSPYNEFDKTPSCHLYEDHFWDYSTGRGGDVIDLYMAFTGCSWGQAIYRLGKGVQQLDADEGRVKRAPVEPPLDFFPRWAELESDWVEIMWMGGVPPDYFKSLRNAGYLKTVNGELIIPHWDDTRLPAVKVRHAAGNKTAWMGSRYVRLYRTEIFEAYPDTAIIMEGESDAWAMDAHLRGRADVFALPSGAGTWKDSWLPELDKYERIYTCFDNDRAGKQATDKVARAIGYGRWEQLEVPTLINDAREALSRGWEPRIK